MTTKLEVLSWYNQEHGTTYTLTTLGAELVRQKLLDTYMTKKYRDLVVPELV